MIRPRCPGRPTPTTCSRCRCAETGSTGSSGRDRARVRPQSAHVAIVPARRRPRPARSGRLRAAGARQPRRRRDGLRPGRQALRRVGDLGRRGEMQNLEQRPDPAHRRRPVRRPGARQRSPERRHPAHQRRRLDAERQPLLRRGRRDRRRGGREHPAALRLRAPQHLRDRLRSGLGEPLGPAERRRRVRRDQPRRARHERRLDPDHGSGLADRAVQGRSSSRCLRPAESRAPSSSRSAGRRRNIADTPQEALSRLFMLPGRATAIPSSAGSSRSRRPASASCRARARAAVPERPVRRGGHAGDLGGHLFRFNLTGNRRKIGVDDPRLEDRVADNVAKNDITESESLLFGTEFGVSTDIETGPNGNLFVVSLSQGAVYEIFRR